MTARALRPPQKLLRCQLTFRQDSGAPQRCRLPPRFLVDLSQAGAQTRRLWVCRLHADPRMYEGSGCTVRLAATDDPAPGEGAAG